MRLNMRARLILAGIICLTVALGLLWLYIHQRPPAPTKTPETTEILMRNLSWDTNLEKFTPYRKNDDLEFIFITEAENSNQAKVDLSALTEKLEISEILVNDTPASLDNLEKIHFDSSLKITVRGKAKEALLIQEPLEWIVKIQFEKKQEKTEEIPDAKKLTSDRIPHSITINKGVLSSNINQLLEISGSNDLDTIDRVIIGEKTFVWLALGNTYYVTIPKNTFWNWDFFLGLYLKNGKLITTDEKVSFVYHSSPINIGAVTPSEIKSDVDRYVVVQGNGFEKIISIQLSNNLIFKNTLFNVVNDNVVSIKIPKWLEPGRYYFNIMDTAGIYEAKNMPFTVIP